MVCFMKKAFSAIISLCLVFTMSFALMACGSDDSKNNSSSSEVSSSQQESSSEESSSSDAPASGKYATIQEFVESDAMQSQLESVTSQAEASGMKFDIYGEGNKLVYAYTFSEDVDVSGMGDALKEALNEQADTFKGVAKSIPLAVDVDSATVVVKYINHDGTEICSEEFTAE